MNHIKNIEIKNFKSIRHQTIDDCRKVNVFIGYPNVGKSNIIEALRVAFLTLIMISLLISENYVVLKITLTFSITVMLKKLLT